LEEIETVAIATASIIGIILAICAELKERKKKRIEKEKKGRREKRLGKIGMDGEELCVTRLDKLSKNGYKGKILRNVYVPKGMSKETSEIDVIYITQKGIFVIESKNFSGKIYGKEEAEKWTAVIPKNGFEFYNPVKQNNTHIYWLEKYLQNDIPLISLIVFSDRCELADVPKKSEIASVLKIGELYKTISKTWNVLPDCLTESQVKRTYNRLKQLCCDSDKKRKEHKRRVREACEKK